VICIIQREYGIIAFLGRVLKFRMEGGKIAVPAVAVERIG
jgi:hypothetical protein